VPAYVVIEVQVTDPVAYEAYRTRMPASIERHGGKPLARGFTERLEGDSPFDRMSILEFPDAETAKRWFESAEVRELSAMRRASSVSTAKMIIPA
jgi:uncharacterized protein (DUF1330 family)